MLKNYLIVHPEERVKQFNDLLRSMPQVNDPLGHQYYRLFSQPLRLGGRIDPCENIYNLITL
jgi:hypothetical protein